MRRSPNIATETKRAARASRPHIDRGALASRPHIDRGARASRPQATAIVTRAFSLAELMIALVILGLGLLFIAAALPVGMEYTRQTVDLATADAAGEYATQQLELALRTSVTLADDVISKSTGPSGVIIHRLDAIHRPRDWDVNYSAPNYQLNFVFRPSYEPIFKVRPLGLANISMDTFGTESHPHGAVVMDDPERTIAAYLALPGFLTGFRSFFSYPMSNDVRSLEYDFFPQDTTSPPLDRLSLDYNPVLPGVARVYPPISPVLQNTNESGFSVQDFFGNVSNWNVSYHPYQSRIQNSYFDALLYNERDKAIDARFVWTAFYRRISYRCQIGADIEWYDPTKPNFAQRSSDDVADAPLLYEIIYVIAQRPTVNHRFPRQDLSALDIKEFAAPDAAVGVGSDIVNIGLDRLAPTPWLVTFQTIPLLKDNIHYEYVSGIPGPTAATSSERYLLPTFSQPPTLTFTCSNKVGQLLPPGSIFIPALNDQCYYKAQSGGVNLIYQHVGFVPSGPEALPIYEVLERVNDPATPTVTTLIVKNPGYYPWVNSNPPNAADYWPVWIIPPAFTQKDRFGQPIYETKSPIVKIIRRTITLPEIKR